MSNSLGEELSADMAAAIASYEQEFSWNGFDFPCVIEFSQSRIVVSRTDFPSDDHPSFGDQITVAGEIYQVKSLNDSTGYLTAGGLVVDKPFIDDPNNPALIIGFGKFITK